MRKLVISVVLLLLTVPVSAQQGQSTAVDRVAVALGQCVGRSETLADQLNAAHAELAAAREKIRELESKDAESKKK